jgi:hypothetical protein
MNPLMRESKYKYRYLLSLVFSVVILFQELSAQNITFIDTNLEQCLLSDVAVNTNGDGVIDTFEARASMRVKCQTASVENLTGLENFINLTELSLQTKNVSAVNLNFCSKLEVLSLNDKTGDLGGIDSLNILSNPELAGIFLSNTSLRSISFDSSINIEVISIKGSRLSDTLTLKSTKKLTQITITDSEIKHLQIDPMVAQGLTDLNLHENLLDSINLVGFNNLLRLDVSNNDFASVVVSNLGKIQRINCENNVIERLNVSGLSDLIELKCNANNIELLDISDNTSLQTLEVESNNLSSLNLANGNNKFMKIDSRFNSAEIIITNGIGEVLQYQCRYPKNWDSEFN